MVIVPADQLTGVGMRLVRDAVTHNKNGVLILHLAHQRFNDLPQVR